MSTEKEIKNEAAVAASAEQTANAEVQTPKKRRGRGINNDLRDVTRKKFDERTDCNKSNGLFIGHLEDVKVDWATLKDDVQGMPSFAGMSIPYITFTFASNHENINERRYVTQRLLPAESNVETIPGGKGAWKVDNIFRFMKHIYNVFVLKGRDLTEEEIDALTLPFEDFDENMQYVPVEAEEVIAGYKTVFENYVKLLNNNGKPVYNDAKGKPITIWMKLLRFIKNDGKWRAVVGSKSSFGDLGFPTFINDGVIELYKEQSAPSLHIDPYKESIVYQKSAEQAKQPNVAMPGVGVIPGVQTAAPMNSVGGFNGGGDFSPFGGGNDAAGAFVNPTEDLPF